MEKPSCPICDRETHHEACPARLGISPDAVADHMREADRARAWVAKLQAGRDTYLRSQRASLVADLRRLSVAGLVALSAVVLP